ncbi:hypothetical protein [Aureibacter tunicatorum]|uniref:Uncharacterized protein n=1 Tax=Aureibacter tunicatorum TaxID=866807 RepID=A0AAE4BTC6_9BACT|nr:hypothetical protein [Aureibacter tunicatorum]MDR6239427.1 hypothetical protein [Aureibacter tunicatorum]BDD04650.1 hypothetical protein AUTU_21330 [Aureibacter tunicatorum]
MFRINNISISNKTFFLTIIVALITCMAAVFFSRESVVKIKEEYKNTPIRTLKAELDIKHYINTNIVPFVINSKNDIESSLSEKEKVKLTAIRLKYKGLQLKNKYVGYERTSAEWQSIERDLDEIYKNHQPLVDVTISDLEAKIKVWRNDIDRLHGRSHTSASRKMILSNLRFRDSVFTFKEILTPHIFLLYDPTSFNGDLFIEG